MIKTCEQIIKNQEVGNDAMGFKDVGWENLDKILMEKYMKSPLYRLNSLAVAEEGSATHTDGHATSRHAFSSGMTNVKMKEMSLPKKSRTCSLRSGSTFTTACVQAGITCSTLKSCETTKNDLDKWTSCPLEILERK